MKNCTAAQQLSSGLALPDWEWETGYSRPPSSFFGLRPSLASLPFYSLYSAPMSLFPTLSSLSTHSHLSHLSSLKLTPQCPAPRHRESICCPTATRFSWPAPSCSPSLFSLIFSGPLPISPPHPLLIPRSIPLSILSLMSRYRLLPATLPSRYWLVQLHFPNILFFLYCLLLSTPPALHFYFSRSAQCSIWSLVFMQASTCRVWFCVLWTCWF
jgi:hypothetical protein